MPLTEQQKRKVIELSGFNPDEYELVNDSFIRPREFAQPEVSTPSLNEGNEVPVTSVAEPQFEDSTFGAVKRGFIRSAPVAAAGGVGLATGAGLSTGLGLTGAAAFAPPVLLSLGLGYGMNKLLDILEPEEYTKQLQYDVETHPWASNIGSLATIPIGGFNPSMAMTRAAGGGALKAITGASITPIERVALQNVGYGSVIGAGTPFAQAGLEGRFPTLSEVTTGAATGAFFNRPNVIGRSLGFTDPLAVPRTLPNAADLQPPIDVESTVTTAPVDVVETFGAPRERGFKQVEGGSKAVTAMPGVEVGKPLRKGQYRQSLEEVDIPTFEGEGGRVTPAELESPKVEDFFKAKAEIAEQQRQANVERQRLELEKQKQDLQSTLRNNQLLADEVRTRPIAETDEVTVMPDYTGVTEADNVTVKAESAADLEARRIEARLSGEEQPKFQEESTTARPTTEFEQQINKKLEESGVPTNPTAEWHAKFTRFGAEQRNTKVEPDGTITNTKTGAPIAGVSWMRRGIHAALAKINPQKAGLDTHAHELFHVFADDLERAGNAADKKLISKWYKLIEDSPEFKSINEARLSQGKDAWTPNEFATTEQGMEFLRRNLNLSGETSFQTFWKDFWSHIKTKYGGDSATNADFRRLMQYRFQNDPAFHEYYKTGVKLSSRFTGSSDVSTKNQDETVLNRQTDIDEYKRLDTIRRKMQDDGSFMLPDKSNFTPEYLKIWQQMEDVKNKYGGYPPHYEGVKPKMSEESSIEKLRKEADKAFDDSVHLSKTGSELDEATKRGELSDKIHSVIGGLEDARISRNQDESSLVSERRSFAPFLTSRIDKIAETIKTPLANYVTDNLHKFSKEVDIQTGRVGNELILAAKDYTPEQIQKVYHYAYDIDDSGRSAIALSPSEKTLFNSWVKILQDVRELQNTLGLKVKEGKTYRVGGMKPEGYMFNILDTEVAHTWAQKPDSAEAKSYDKAYIDHLVKHGITPAEAKKALHQYKGALGDNVPQGTEFAALREAEGAGLPWQLIDKNFASAAVRYGRRAGKDLAYFKYIQNDPKMRKALNLRDQYGKLPTADELPDVTPINSQQAVQEAMRSVEGIDKPRSLQMMAAARAAGNTVMGIGTAARNILNMPSFIANYVQLKQLPLVAKAFANMNDSRARAFRNNAVRASFAEFDAAGYYLGSPNPAIRLLNRYSEFMRKYQGRNFSDKFEGEFYYSLGELMATDNLARAKTGDREARLWVDKFATTVEGGAEALLKRKVTMDDIERMAKSFVDSARGTYSEQGLPSWAIEGEFAPFAALSRFSIEKSNTIWKDVIQPLRKGIYGPALRYTLASFGVGALIEKLNEVLSGKRGPDPTLAEVSEAGDTEDQIAKAIGLLQLASFAGIVSDGAKIVSNVNQNKSLRYSQPLSFPLYTLVSETILGNIADATQAIKEGNDPMEVLGQLAIALSTQSVQTARYIEANTWNKEETERKEKFRDINTWMILTDRKDPEDGVRSNPFLDRDMKKFKRTEDVGEAAEMLPELIKKAMDNSKDKSGRINVDKLRANLRKLKANSYQTMPSPDNMPQTFLDYLNFLRNTQGEDAAQERLVDYIRKREVNKAKASMVPSA